MAAVHDETKADTYAVVAPNTTVILSRDPEFTKEASITKRANIVKPVEIYDILGFYGPNVVLTEGSEWLRHRCVPSAVLIPSKIVQPAFSDNNLRYVVETSVKFTDEFTDSLGESKVVNVTEALIQLTLKVICQAGFGYDFEEAASSKGNTKDILEAFHVVSNDNIWKIMIPDIAYKLLPFERIQRIKRGFDNFEIYLKSVQQLITERGGSEARDLATQLYMANNDVTEGPKLSLQEMLSNIYIFLIAGHETTANALIWCLWTVAHLPHIQEKMREEINRVLPGGTKPSYEDTSKLVYCEAVFKEILRFRSPVIVVPKLAAENVTIAGVQLSKGDYIGLHSYAMHFHPREWTNPEKFDPERFFGPTNPNAFNAFSKGPRFSQVEAIAILAGIFREYNVLPLKPNSRYEDMDGRAFITYHSVEDIQLRFERVH